MTTVADLHDAVLTRLRSISTISTFDADVPSAPPADATGRVYPYAVLWAAGGATSPERAISGAAGLDWYLQVTVAAGDPGWCLRAVDLVRDTLTATPLLPGVQLVDETPRSRTILRDDDVTPRRWFLPLSLSCLTP